MNTIESQSQRLQQLQHQHQHQYQQRLSCSPAHRFVAGCVDPTVNVLAAWESATQQRARYLNGGHGPLSVHGHGHNHGHGHPLPPINLQQHQQFPLTPISPSSSTSSSFGLPPSSAADCFASLESSQWERSPPSSSSSSSSPSSTLVTGCAPPAVAEFSFSFPPPPPHPQLVPPNLHLDLDDDNLLFNNFHLFDHQPQLPTPISPSPSPSNQLYNSSLHHDGPRAHPNNMNFSTSAAAATKSKRASPEDSDDMTESPTTTTKKPRACMSMKDFVPPDVTGLSKREARLVKNRAAAFLSRQRKREEFELMEVYVFCLR